MGSAIGTLATGLACGVITPPQTFRQLYTFFEAFYFLWLHLEEPDQDIQEVQEHAQTVAIRRCVRTYRGVPDLTQAGVCYTKDALYLRGLWTIERAIKEDEQVLDRLAVGIVAVEHLPDLQELGIVHAPQPLRKLVEDPGLDATILSFENSLV